MTRDLIIARCGTNSLHPAWVEGQPDRTWDLYLCPYQPVPFQTDASAGVMVGEVIPGQKWTGLRALLRGWDGWTDYRYVMLADDDLLAPPEIWSEFFHICKSIGAKLAQPALTPDSFFFYPLTMKNLRFERRRVGFVEIMAPCFRVDVLQDLLPTLDLTETGFGWGLDTLWPKLLAYEDIHIVDRTPIRHTRPVGTARDPEALAAGIREEAFIRERYDCRTLRHCFEGTSLDGRTLSGKSIGFWKNFINGYFYLYNIRRKYFRRALQAQLDVFARR
jgi:hypothetical protein